MVKSKSFFQLDAACHLAPRGANQISFFKFLIT